MTANKTIVLTELEARALGIRDGYWRYFDHPIFEPVWVTYKVVEPAHAREVDV